MTGFLEQFAVFGADAAGLERMFRLLQSICQILIAYPAILAVLLPNIGISATAQAATLITLPQLRGRLNVTRRTLRLFRFLGSFQASWQQYAGTPADGKSVETWIDVVGKSCLGMYGLLESVTLIDISGFTHLEIFGPETTKNLNRQAQIFWFVALYASALNSAIGLLRIFAFRPVPQTGTGYGIGGDSSPQEGKEKKQQDEWNQAPEEDDEDGSLSKEEQLAKERSRLRAIAEKRKGQRKAWIEETMGKIRGLSLKLVTDVLDMLLPVSAVGWLQVDPGLVGLAMLVTSAITGKAVWDKCGRTI